ncbi:WhiB-like transcription regulator [Pseudonocardia sp. Ae406_Ps2]|uniref:WhiB family transcriptional regulator n=2 Tax=Pseudonocardia TaxID=1847 RepID=UPI00095ACFD7|nr:WhiB-like transcription regulator [Pseudonocardia sp. Ae406_Ps2]OLM25125.1 WhiB-like transcription regulator [Pseudonocardia sp. Ae706_Ps2]OLM34654.1 WhiB-like transcription regulator [Pseudonocardia sp. Ae717_Ps2]
MNDRKQMGRPGDGILAEHDRRAALTNQYVEAGEMTSVNPSPGRVDELDWRTRAACRDVDPELFFPTATAGAALIEAESAAVAVCTGCPVIAECRRWAVAEQPHGIAGGLTEAQRTALRHPRPARRGRPVGVRVPVSVRGARHRETGRAALAAGAEPGLVAAQCGVTRRTAERWAAELRRDHRVAVGVRVGGGR